MDIKLSKTNIRKQVGGSLLTSILALGRTFGPTIAKTFGLSALAGAASTGAIQIVKKIAGKGVQRGGFLIPQKKLTNSSQTSIFYPLNRRKIYCMPCNQVQVLL